MTVNKVILAGHVGKDPEVRTFDSGTSKASFSLATSERYKNKDGEMVNNTEWHNIVVWGKQAEIIEQYVKKGSHLYIEGKITSRGYESDGVTKYITEIKADSFVFLDKKGGGTGESTPDDDSLPF